MSTNSPNPLARFDPNRVAHYETENYIAYYQRRWGKLLLVSITGVIAVPAAFALTAAAEAIILTIVVLYRLHRLIASPRTLDLLFSGG